MIPYYDETKITRVFNQYVLFLIPFYFAVCIFVFLFSTVFGQPTSFKIGEKDPEREVVA